ncbi:uncharacterized protein Dwil_GK25362 [Drosophila willistoni]|uniref:Uncharacterized protein n=1 Tax=Drosophila willistoni TaxID=7260 RepID=B4NE32_DROWI|nr:uncharacterized protein LOC6649012 [Drosophila willistoni]EDW82001.1 uncharacterized protein Dwil_GK25362 [Drosophila willistoni]
MAKRYSQSIMNYSLILAIVVLSLCLGHLQGAAILCGSDSEASVASKSVEESLDSTVVTPTKKPSELNKLLHTVQCSLEKAKPWIENIEKEAKNLEETAKRVGLRIVHSFGDIMDSFLETVGQRKPLTSTTQKPEIEEFSVGESSSPSSSATAPSSTAESVTVESTESPLINANDAENEILGLK